MSQLFDGSRGLAVMSEFSKSESGASKMSSRLPGAYYITVKVPLILVIAGRGGAAAFGHPRWISKIFVRMFTFPLRRFFSSISVSSGSGHLSFNTEGRDLHQAYNTITQDHFDLVVSQKV